MKKAVFTIDGFAEAYIGYTKGDHWNGWATPHFEKSDALRVMDDYNKNTESPMFYNEEFDTFYHFGTDSYEGAMWKGADYQTEEGIKHLYDIGAYCWVWDAVNDNDRRYIAQQVEEFIFYYDTYTYWDEYDDRREETVAKITEQLKDFDVLKQTIIVMFNEDLSSETKYKTLGGILNV